MAGLSANLLRYITREAAASTPDAVLLRRFVTDRDNDAFTALIRRHGPIVYRVCRRLLGPTAADDAFQATFLVLATRARSVRKAGSLGSWLIGVAGRVARQMHKAERRRAVRERAAALIPLRKCEADPLESAEQVRILEVELTRLWTGSAARSWLACSRGEPTSRRPPNSAAVPARSAGAWTRRSGYSAPGWNGGACFRRRPRDWSPASVRRTRRFRRDWDRGR